VRKVLAHEGAAAVNAKDMYQRTPLENAARQNLPEVAELLMKAGADANHKDMTDRTALGLAVESNAVGVVRVLLDHGADPLVPYGGKARRITVKDWRLIHAAAWGPYPEVAELLLAAGVKHDVHSAAGLGDVAALAKLLDEGGAELEATRMDGRTPLHWAAMNGQTETVRYLIDRGAAIDAKDVADRTPLYQAAAKAHEAAATLLIDAGAEATVFDAAGVGHLSKLRELLDEGLSASAASGTTSSMAGGASEGNGEEGSGRRIDPSDGEAYTRTDFLELYDGDEEAWNAAKPEPKADTAGAGTAAAVEAADGTSVGGLSLSAEQIAAVVDVRNGKGETSLFAASRANQLDAVRLLLERGADVNVVDSHRDTALVACADAPDALDAAQVLIAHGGRGIIGICRRANHSKGRAAMAGLVAQYFRRESKDGDLELTRRQELQECLRTRASSYFKLDDQEASDPVGDALQAAQLKLLRDEV
jgi:ankyrin repeat protein